MLNFFLNSESIVVIIGRRFNSSFAFRNIILKSVNLEAQHPISVRIPANIETVRDAFLRSSPSNF